MMRKMLRWLGGVVALALGLQPGAVTAAVTLQVTRVVYPSEQQEVAVQLKNSGDHPALLQAWISDDDMNQLPEDSQAPFIIDKPLLRLEPGKSQALRIRGLPARAPQDGREHLYWLNVLDIPPKSAPGTDNGNEVQVAVRIRLRVLYRPQGVGAPQDPDSHVRIRRSAAGLALRNSAAHYFNVGSFALLTAAGEVRMGSFHIDPGGEHALVFPEELQGPVTGVRYEWIDDEGGLHEVRRSL
jgi:P pilus assembly chaperone PapD